MPKKTPSEGALFVRLPAKAVDKLDRAAEALGMRKKDLVAGLVTKYVDPDSPRGLSGSTYFVTRPATRSFLRIPSASAARSSLSTAFAGRRTNSAPSDGVFFGISERYPEISRSQVVADGRGGRRG